MPGEVNPAKAEKIDRSIEGARERMARLGIISESPITGRPSDWMGEEGISTARRERLREGTEEFMGEEVAKEANRGRGIIDKITGGNRVDVISALQYEAEKINEVYDPEKSKEESEARAQRKADFLREAKEYQAEKEAREKAEAERLEALEKEGKIEISFSYDVEDVARGRRIDQRMKTFVGTPQELIEAVEGEALEVEWGEGNGSHIQTNAQVQYKGEQLTYDQFLQEMRKKINSEATKDEASL